ncbi:hypothetical protein C6P46_004117 [Rhodotorula mucilaginosa]|uniref:Transmembrane protein n=1 Tax=Rhodotorula mucilaginosa TaxID=5537 RepID=A0A9P6W0E6_RHOMI|nr:hypothetical protein C6P46_004117 [Rhodotorula mucilaginosa]
MLSPTTRSNYARRHRLHALGLALASIVWHLWLSAYLSSVATGLAGDSASSASDDGFAGRDGDDARDWEGAERRRIEGVRALLGIARFWSWCSVGVAIGGLFGILSDHLALIRLFMLNGFLSLSLDLVLLSTIFLILTVGNPSSADGSSGLATTVCQALSSSVSGATSLPVPFSIGLPDLLGLSLEACEEQFEGVLVSALGALAIVEGARAWVAVRILGYYALLVRSRMPSSARTARGGDEFYDSPVELEGTTAPRSGLFRSPSSRSSSSASTMTPHTKKKRRESHGEAAHASAGSASDRRSKPRERERSGSLRSGEHKKRSSGDESTRIFLLPRSEERGTATAAAAATAAMSQREQEVPLLTLTTSSPVSSTFPPMRHHQSGPPNPPGGSRDVDAGLRRVLVYAPVFVSPEEARSLGAKEVVLGGHHHHHHQQHSRRRGDSHPPLSSPSAASASPRLPHASSSSSRHHASGMPEPMTPVRSRSSTITPGSASSNSNSNSGETTPRLGHVTTCLGGGSSGSINNNSLSPVKTSSPLRTLVSHSGGTSMSRSLSTPALKIDPPRHPTAVPTPTRQDSLEDMAKTPVASLSGQNIALGPAYPEADKGNIKLA